LSLIIFIFFFSSRRRHTRSKRDWSSDVCSSDLEVHGALRHRLAIRPLALLEGKTFAHLLHNAAIDAVELFSRDRATERNVESRVVGADPRAFLDDVLAERFTQRLVQEVRGGVVAHDLAPAFLVD